MGEISFRETSGLEVVWLWGTFFAQTAKERALGGGFALPETDPLGPAGARVLTTAKEPKLNSCGKSVCFSALREFGLGISQTHWTGTGRR